MILADSIVTLVNSIVTRIWPDKTEQQKNELAVQLQEAIMQSDLAKSQMEINKVEAGSASIFVSGWRPFIGWVCGTAFAWTFVGEPILVFLLVSSGHPIPHMPQLDSSQLMTVLFGLLGLGGMRTYERVKGVTK